MGESTQPIEHISIRVPWHDGGWNGTVCHAADPVLVHPAWARKLGSATLPANTH
jgi:hypothetical protein